MTAILPAAMGVRFAEALGLYPGCTPTLVALSQLVDNRSGQGRVTIAQVAHRAGLSIRHAHRCLLELRDAGIVVWAPGWLNAGRRVPSWARIAKDVLVALVARLRPSVDRSRAARNRSEAARVAGLTIRTPARRRLPRSPLVDTLSNLPLPGGVPSGDTTSHQLHTYADIGLTVCGHGGELGRCPSCRRAKARQDGAPPRP